MSLLFQVYFETETSEVIDEFASLHSALSLSPKLRERRVYRNGDLMAICGRMHVTLSEKGLAALASEYSDGVAGVAGQVDR